MPITSQLDGTNEYFGVEMGLKYFGPLQSRII